MSSSPPRSDALRLLLTPKWVGLTLLVVILGVLFAMASSWQYQRAIHQVEAQRAAATEPQPIAELVPGTGEVPAASLGRAAVVAGSYVADAWVVGRASVDGEPGVWLISGLDDGSGLLTPVLRGWLPGKATVTDPVEPVTVNGRVSSAENFYNNVPARGPDELVAITSQRLAQIWQRPMRAGYVVLQAQDPALTADDPQPVEPVFGVANGVGFPWQNAGYAVQWIGFIGFIGFVYWRWFRDDLQRSREESAEQPEQGDRITA